MQLRWLMMAHPCTTCFLWFPPNPGTLNSTSQNLALHFKILSCTVHSYGMLVSVFLPTRCAVGKSIALESGRPRLESQLLPVACVT